MPDQPEAQRGQPRPQDGSLAKPPKPARIATNVQAHASEAIKTLTSYDQDAGWPPRVKGCKDVARVAPLRFETPFPPRLQRQYVDAALRHPEVKAMLHGRSELLGCHLVSHKHRRSRGHCVRVCFANYTEKHLVEVYLRELKVESVAERPNHAHPEAPIEMAQAIALARKDPELSAAVAQLEAHAILQVPNAESPYKNHRCLLVTFTDTNDPHVEREALFAAVVDLNLQKVLKAGRCPCSGDG
jgi:hypothetical protein